MSFFVPLGPTIPPSGNFADLYVTTLESGSGSGGGTPGGSNTQVQFNDNGVFGGTPMMSINGTSSIDYLINGTSGTLSSPTVGEMVLEIGGIFNVQGEVVLIKSSNTTGVDSGTTEIETGDSTSNTGNINIITGEVSVLNNANYIITGDILIRSGNNLTEGADGIESGKVTVTTGTVGNTNSSGKTGDIEIITGTSDVQIGNILLQTGSSAQAPGGDISIITGNTSFGNGGHITIVAGNSLAYNGGNVVIQSGNSGTLGGGSNDSKIFIKTGNAVNGPSGPIDLITGNSDAVGPSGPIRLTTGTTVAGSTGSIEITTGDGEYVGNLLLKTGTPSVGNPGQIILRTDPLLDIVVERGGITLTKDADTQASFPASVSLLAKNAIITVTDASLAASSAGQITVTSSADFMNVNSIITVGVQNWGGTGMPIAQIYSISATSFVIKIYNVDPVNAMGATELKVSFIIN